MSAIPIFSNIFYISIINFGILFGIYNSFKYSIEELQDQILSLESKNKELKNKNRVLKNQIEDMKYEPTLMF